MINQSTFSSIWQSKLARRGAMFTGACLLTLVPICSSSAFTTFTDSPKAIVDEVWQIINTEYVDGTFNHSDWQN
jgi:carboxyl-terminal processing protease